MPRIGEAVPLLRALGDEPERRATIDQDVAGDLDCGKLSPGERL